MSGGAARDDRSAGGVGRFVEAPSGEQLHAFARALFPLHRSITGDGVRASLREIQRLIPLEVIEVPTGTKAFDWEVPREWRIRDAFIADADGGRVIDYADSNLHVMSYSSPVDTTLTWTELEPHLYSLPEHPEWIPYRTSHFEEGWGFCLPHSQRRALAARGDTARYHVRIDSELFDGALSYGEAFFPGESDAEVLVWAHVCHPSLANDNLSGLSVAAHLARHVAALPRRRFGYRFVFAPATIGAITWLSRNQRRASRIRHGLVLTLLGDRGAPTYKKSRRAQADIDRAVLHVLERSGSPFDVQEFSPIGYDERQFCSPGFDLPVGCLMRTPHGEFPQYHTSGDDLDFIDPEALLDSWHTCARVVEILEHDRCYASRKPNCEPRLGPRGLYRAFGRRGASEELQAATLWVLNFADGQHSLLDVAERAELPFASVRRAAEALIEVGLLDETVRES